MSPQERGMREDSTIMSSNPRSRPSATLAAAGAALTVAAVLWLTAAGNLSATGTRIARLEAERTGLAERRARALVAYAAATDPTRLEKRAREMGFKPADEVTFLPVSVPELHRDPRLDPNSPLGLLTASGPATTPTQLGAEAAAAGLPPAGELALAAGAPAGQAVAAP
jgi:hypothetical protein